jgi:methionyl aminopeptidase
MNLYKPEEIAALKEGGQILSDILLAAAKQVAPGVTLLELNNFAEQQIRAAGGVPSFLGYKVSRKDPAFPSTVCTSVNEEVVHGIATDRVLEEGQLLKMDIGMRYKGLCTDMATSVPVGEVSSEVKKLARVTREALRIGIKQCQPGNWVSDIGKAVDKHVTANGFVTVKALVGHGVGHDVHEEPQVPNFHDKFLRPVKLVPGMVLALEPMVNAGSEAVVVMDDSWTIATEDGSLSAHYEVTIAVTENGPEMITPMVVWPPEQN